MPELASTKSVKMAPLCVCPTLSEMLLDTLINYTNLITGVTNDIIHDAINYVKIYDNGMNTEIQIIIFLILMQICTFTYLYRVKSYTPTPIPTHDPFLSAYLSLIQNEKLEKPNKPKIVSMKEDSDSDSDSEPDNINTDPDYDPAEEEPEEEEPAEEESEKESADEDYIGDPNYIAYTAEMNKKMRLKYPTKTGAEISGMVARLWLAGIRKNKR
jgi:hypothetical protein